MAIIGTDPIGFNGVLEAPPYNFLVQIPKRIVPGVYLLNADGFTASRHPVTGSSITIDVERPDAPVKIATDPPSLPHLWIGDQSGLILVGTFADGSTADLTKSTQTTYVSQSPDIATVGAAGLVTAVGAGSTQILINGSLSVPVTVDAPIRIFPSQATLTGSQTRNFVARVTNAKNPAVIWSLDPALGSIDADGLYVAPASVASQQTVTLTATSAADPTKTATATITLSPAASVNVVPGYAVLYAGQMRQFTAIASNTGTPQVRWSISPSGAGAISSAGLYTAPGAIAALQQVTITATSVATPTISGSVKIWISPQP